jgi:hypothetical protein
MQCKTAQLDHQRVGQSRQQQAQLVALEFVATGAPAEQIELRLLDAVLGLTAGALKLLVQGVSIPVQDRDDKAGIGAARIVLEPRNHMTLAIPGSGGIVELPNHALPGSCGFISIGQRQFSQFDLP